MEKYGSQRAYGRNIVETGKSDGSVMDARGWKGRTGSRESTKLGPVLTTCHLEAFCGDLSHIVINHLCTGSTLPTTTPTASTPQNTPLNLPTNPRKASVYHTSSTISLLLLSNLDIYSSPKVSSTQITTYYTHDKDSCRRFRIFLGALAAVELRMHDFRKRFDLICYLEQRQRHDVIHFAWTLNDCVTA